MIAILTLKRKVDWTKMDIMTILVKLPESQAHNCFENTHTQDPCKMQKAVQNFIEIVGVVQQKMEFYFSI